MNDPLRIGVIGVQHEEHVGGFMQAVVAEGSGAKLVGIAERDAKYRADIEQRWPGVRTYEAGPAMLDRERPDAVFVDTINSEKAAAVVECLNRGIPVMANKPLCTTIRQIEEISDACRRSTAALSLQLTERFNPVFIALKRAVESGRLGVPVLFQTAKPHRLHRPGMFRHGRPAWMFDRNAYGGVLVDLAIHDVDLVRWISGEEVQSVSAVTGLAKFAQQHPDFTDYAMTTLQLTNHKAANIEVDWLHPDRPGQVRFIVYGTAGFATFDASLAPGQLLRIDSEGNSEIITGEQVNSTHANAKEFLDAVRDSRTPQPSARDTLTATLVTLCAREAAEKRSSVKVLGTPLFEKIASIGR